MRSAHLTTIYELRMLGKSLSKSLFPLSFELFLVKKGSVGNTRLLLPAKMLLVPANLKRNYVIFAACFTLRGYDTYICDT